jgi:RNA polymerase sigma-70 factor (family 1)
LEIIPGNIIESLKNGDMEAFDGVYRKYCHKLFEFVYHIIKNEPDAEEIVQEVFVKLWESRQRIETYRSFDSYLFTIAYNTTISLVRKRISEKKYVDNIIRMQNESTGTDIADDLSFEQLNDQVNYLVRHLPARQKEVFLLSREKGLTYKEIAVQLEISENTVENHMVKALRFLREKMNRDSLLCLFFICLFL